MARIYRDAKEVDIPKVDLLTLLFEHESCNAREDTLVNAEAAHPDYGFTKAQQRTLTKQIGHFLRHTYDIGKSGPGQDVVLTISTGQSGLASLFYGVVAADGVYSSASPSSTKTDVVRQIKDGDAKLVVCSKELVGVAAGAAQEAGLPPQNVLVFESYPKVTLRSVNGSRECEFRRSLEWRRITDGNELENSRVCLLYSSGTTGLPKGVIVSHTNMVSACILAGTRVQSYINTWSTTHNIPNRTLAHLPTAHIAGLQNYFVQLFHQGATTYWMPAFNFDLFLHYCAELGVAHFFTVPPIYMGIAKHPGAVREKHFGKMMLAVTGAAPLSAEMQRQAGEKLNGVFIGQTWGLTETTGSATLAVPEKKGRPGSLAGLLPNVLMRLVDDNENDVPLGEPGEAWIKGPIVTKGYHNNPKANADSFTKDGWFRTGDILRMENDELYMVDRKKEIIKYKGMQVAPAELEGILASHPAVLDAAIIGVQQEDTEVPRAFVALAPQAKGNVSDKDLVEYVGKQVARHKQLRGGVVFMEAVPRSPSGKILRKELREMVRKGQGSKL